MKKLAWLFLLTVPFTTVSCIIDADDDDGFDPEQCRVDCEDKHAACVVDCTDDDNQCTVDCDAHRTECTSDCG